jgi:hypothetical protein
MLGTGLGELGWVLLHIADTAPAVRALLLKDVPRPVTTEHQIKHNLHLAEMGGLHFVGPVGDRTAKDQQFVHLQPMICLLEALQMLTSG